MFVCFVKVGETWYSSIKEPCTILYEEAREVLRLTNSHGLTEIPFYTKIDEQL